MDVKTAILPVLQSASGRLHCCSAKTAWRYPQYTPTSYMEDIVESLALSVLQLTPAIAALAESGIVLHGDPADRLIAATAITHQALFITADEKLRATPGLHCIW